VRWFWGKGGKREEGSVKLNWVEMEDGRLKMEAKEKRPGLRRWFIGGDHTSH
jgi:hypothetical protein